MYTNDCRNVHPKNFIVKFADDTVILSLLHQDEIDWFIKWCDTNHLILKVTKTQEMVSDPRREADYKLAVIKNQKIIQVS